jgi:hypothetical protein
MSEYFDFEGKPATLNKMVRIEPEWAEARIKAGEIAIKERDTYRELCGQLLEDMRYIKMTVTSPLDAYYIADEAVKKAEAILGASNAT